MVYMAANTRLRKDRIAIQLGMPQGTAMAILRKRLLFSLAKRAGLHLCLRCGREMTVDDFTVDHKEAWEGKATELFWDLDNIAFSHSRCNLQARIPALARFKCPEGMARCSRCKETKALELFHRSKARYNGVSCECKVCRAGPQHWRRIRDSKVCADGEMAERLA